MSDTTKPAQRYTLEISQAELIALVKWNMAQAKGVSRKFGQEVLKIQANNIFGRSTHVMALKKLCQDKIVEHGKRARGLATLLK
jgi:hypothetical protein